MHEPRKGYKYKSSHPLEKLLADISTGIKTIISTNFLELRKGFCAFFSFLSILEPKNHLEVLDDPHCVITTQEELGQFERNQVWCLIPQPL